jgi:hypothetical protein
MLELRKCCRPFNNTDGIIPTKLYTTNVDVDKENKRYKNKNTTKTHALTVYSALDSLPAEEIYFEADEGGEPEKLKNCPAIKNMVLKIGNTFALQLCVVLIRI